jgi:hypothetical protein
MKSRKARLSARILKFEEKGRLGALAINELSLGIGADGMPGRRLEKVCHFGWQYYAVEVDPFHLFNCSPCALQQAI